MRHLKEGALSGNLRPQTIQVPVNSYDTSESIKVSIGVQVEIPKPICGHCGELMSSIPFRVSGPEGPYYRIALVCSNKGGEGNCPSYSLFGKQIVDVTPDKEAA